MKIRKAVKKLIALGTGVTMLGATVLGAMAADLSQYPKPMFIDSSGAFNAAIVVGEAAKTGDVIGAVDIATSLQYAASKPKSVGTGASASFTIDEGYKIEKPGSKFNYGKDIYDVEPTQITADDLPAILADGTYDDSEGSNNNKVDYSQKIQFTDATGTLQYYQDDEYAPTAGPYLYFPEGTTIYTYTLQFDTAVDYSTTAADVKEDFQSTTLSLQGKTYTVTDASASATILTKLTLLAGENSFWIQSGTPVTKTIGGTEYEITLVGVNSAEDKCTLTVNGVTTTINVNSNKDVSGLTVGVTDANVIQNADAYTHLCKVDLGAEELVLEDGKRVKQNDEYVDGSLVTFTAGAGTLTKIAISYAPQNDPVYIAPGKSWTDPVFGNFKLSYGGDVRDDEEISLTTSAKSGNLKFTNYDGKLVNLPLYRKSSASDNVWYGKSDTEEVHFSGGNCTQASDGCTNEYFLVVANKIAHLMKIQSITISSGEIEIYDETYDKTYKDNFLGHSTTSTIEVGSAGTIQLKVYNTTTLHGVYFVDTDDGTGIYTKGENRMYLPATDNAGMDPLTFVVAEKDTDARDSNVTVDLAYDQTDEKIQIDTPTFDDVGTYGGNSGFVDKSDTDSDNQVAATNYGTIVAYNSQDKNKVLFTIPKGTPTYGEVFVSPVAAVVTEGGNEGGTTVNEPVKINVGAALLDTDVAGTETTRNLIVVGGPAANRAAATLLGVPFPSYGAASTVPENEAMIKLVENGNYVAVLVAGWDVDDTRRASRALAKYDTYALKGKSMKVTGISMTDISVSALA